MPALRLPGGIQRIYSYAQCLCNAGNLKECGFIRTTKAQQIINRESSQGLMAESLWSRLRQVFIIKASGIRMLKEWAEITGREDVVKGINKGVELLASSQIEKIPVDKNMYASITTNAEGTAQAIFQKQSQHTLSKRDLSSCRRQIKPFGLHGSFRIRD